METRRCYTINNEEIIQKLHIWKQAEDKGLTELLTSSNLLCGKLLCVGEREGEPCTSRRRAGRDGKTLSSIFEGLATLDMFRTGFILA